MRILTALVLATALASPCTAAAQPTPAAQPSAPTPSPPAPARTVDLKGPTGAVMGRVTLWTAPGGVLIRIEARGLTPGWHGLHLHQTGDCTGPAFTSAGPHMAGAQHGAHGLLSASGPEAGDLPNLFVGPEGRGAAEVFTRTVSVSPGAEVPALLDADGSALVVHASPDDQATQPTGGSGARVACAVIR